MDDDSRPPTPRTRAQSESLAAAMEEFHRQEQRPLPGGLIHRGPVVDNEPQRQQPVAPQQEEMSRKKTLAQEEKEVKERLRQNLHARRQQKMAQAPAERAESEARAARENLRQEEQRQTTIAQMMMVHAAQADLIARPHFSIQLDQQEMMNLQQQQQRQHSMMRAHAIQAELIARPHVPIQFDQQELMQQQHPQQQQQHSMRLQEMHEVARAQQMQIDEVQRPISPIHPPIYMDEQQMHLQAQQQRQHSMMMAHAAQADLIARPHFPIQLDQQEIMNLQQQQQQHSMIRLQEMHEVARAQQMQIDEVQRPISPESEARAARENLRQEEQPQTTIAQMMRVHAIQADLIARPHFPIQLDQQEIMNLQQQQQQHSMMRLQEMHEVARAQQMQIDEVQRPISPIHPPIYMDEQQLYLEEQQRQRDMLRAQQMQSAIMDMQQRSDDLEREQSQLMFLVQRQQEHQQNMDAVLQMQSQMIVQQHFPMSSLDTSDVPLSSDYPHDLIRSKDQKKKLQKRRPKVKTEPPSTPPPRPPTPPNLSYLAHLEDLERKRLIKQIQSMDLTKPAPEQKPPELRTVRERILELNPNLTEEEIAQRVTALEKARIPNPNKVHPHIIDIAQDLRAFIDNIRENRQLQHELQCNQNVKSFYYHDAMNSLARWRADKDDKQLKKEFKKDMKRWRKAAKKNLRRAKANLYCRQERWLTHTDCQLYQRLAIKYGLKVDLEDYNSDED